MGEVIKYFSILSAVILIATSCNGGGNKSNLESELDDVAMNVVEEAPLGLRSRRALRSKRLRSPPRRLYRDFKEVKKPKAIR